MSAISVSVKVFGGPRRFLPKESGDEERMSLPEGATVSDVFALLQIPPDLEVTPGLNGKLANRDTVLHEGDNLTLFGPMEGG